MMTSFLQQNQLHVSNILQPFFLSQFRFQKRFIKSSRIEDPFTRIFDISHDTEKDNKRIAIKDYSASSKTQRDDVLTNLESYKYLEEVQGISKLVAFCHIQSTGDIMAAFQYNDSTLYELIDMHFFEENRNQFYLFIFKELLYVHQTAKNFQIQLEDLLPQNVLLYKIDNYFRIKIFFDERQKKNDKIIEGIKTFCSVQSIERQLGLQNKYQRYESCEFIFQLGLFLLDFIYAYEVHCMQKSSLKQGATPIDLYHQSYHVFQDTSSVKLNTNLINQKKNFLKTLRNDFIQSTINIIDKMIVPIQQRIGLQELTLSQKLLENTQYDQNVDIDFSTLNRQISPVKQKRSPNDSLKYSQQREIHSYSPNQQNIATSTTLTKNVFIQSGPKIESKNSNSSHLSINYNIIPKNKILSQINAHKCVRDQLYKFMQILQSKSTVIRKQYLDNSVYYGQIDPKNHKRHGYGMYLRSDLYFGDWKDNNLIDGIYIFKNSDCFEGVVKNGKQGWGRYYYADGKIYEGEWKDDLKCGRGKMSYANGDVYDGMWLNGKRHGQGIYYYQDGAVYKGNFINGKKEGFGIIVFPNQTRVEAYWMANQISGNGKIFYSNGHYYQGGFNYCLKQGSGTYKWQDQTKYEGQFKKDLMLGKARINFFQNQFYQGNIQNGKRQGYGVYRYTNGDEFKGQWRNDEKFIGQYKFHDRRFFDGRFKKNEMSYGVMIYQNGDSYQGQFLKGERHGTGSYRNSAGEIIFDGKWVKDKFVHNL